jgi:hypothetical protein
MLSWWFVCGDLWCNGTEMAFIASNVAAQKNCHELVAALKPRPQQLPEPVTEQEILISVSNSFTTPMITLIK